MPGASQTVALAKRAKRSMLLVGTFTLGLNNLITLHLDNADAR